MGNNKSKGSYSLNKFVAGKRCFDSRQRESHRLRFEENHLEGAQLNSTANIK